jgi:hypothetical protein
MQCINGGHAEIFSQMGKKYRTFKHIAAESNTKHAHKKGQKDKTSKHSATEGGIKHAPRTGQNIPNRVSQKPGQNIYSGQDKRQDIQREFSVRLERKGRTFEHKATKRKCTSCT